MLELIITNPTNEDSFLKTIEFNYEELKKGISEAVKKYDNLVVTEDAIKQAKTDRANLNKFIAAMDKKRIEVKNQCLQAYEPFEVKIKELEALVDEPCKKIDKQIKKFEDEAKEEKKKLLKEYFENVPKDNEVAGFITFDDFIKNREQLLNKSYNLNNAYAEIEHWLSKILEHLCILKAQSETLLIDYSTLKIEYKKSDFDFAKVVEYANQIKAEKDKRTSNIPEDLQIKLTSPQAEETAKRVEFWCEVTPSQARLMQKFLKENNIKYGAIKR